MMVDSETHLVSSAPGPMIFSEPLSEKGAPRDEICRAYCRDEAACVEALLPLAGFSLEARARIDNRARDLIAKVRAGRHGGAGVDAFMREYALSSQEGVVLMCLAEALLRIPDADTANRLIRDKLADADWTGHLGKSDSLFVNASTWGLMLTGRLVSLDSEVVSNVGTGLARLIAKGGEPIVRQALTNAMRIIGRQFVMGRTISEALDRVSEAAGYRHSFDMLGEAACTVADAERYYSAYLKAIEAVGAVATSGEFHARPSVSVKLSALHPRYEPAQRRCLEAELAPRLRDLAWHARARGIGLTVDAEEAERLELQLDLFEAVYRDPELAGWQGLGLAVQAYQKRALAVLDWLAVLAREGGQQIPLRLVKGAYWDAEIKRGQELGLGDYPVFTRKVSTDVSYLACARKLFSHGELFFSQFATHNAHTVSAVMEIAEGRRDFEFQRLHGMGEALYRELAELDIPCRIYAPVGGHEDLLAYLVRRLLENGANTSFVNRIEDDRMPVENVVADPVTKLGALKTIPHPRIPRPPCLFGQERRNSRGVDLSDEVQLGPLARAMTEALSGPLEATALVDGREVPGGEPRPVLDPANNRRQVGLVSETAQGTIEEALSSAQAAAAAWAATPPDDRAACLDRLADMIEDELAAAMAICVREAGKTIADAVAEVREAVDYCRYYATRARAEFANPRQSRGATGEHNAVSLHGRGVFLCLSPWNFPLAIFSGQITAALAAGNAVIAKPAEQTPLMAAFAVRLMHRAGIPGEVVHLLPGDGPRVGAPLVADPRIDGIAFTGSSETAWAINRALAARPGPIVPLIAETGGQNTMIVDSTALIEQVVGDILASAFGSAGQRCSALRVLFVQEDIGSRLLTTLAGAMDALVIGDPALLRTDVGPVIDSEARRKLDRHVGRLAHGARLVRALPLPPEAGAGTFVAPCAFEIDTLAEVEGEQFGPVLHVIRFAAGRLDEVIAAINATGYGLTLGVHSRIDATAKYIRERVRAGNVYVNRSMIGAVVGVQPFGGEGLSGTGPKAGGPRYLHRFASERTVSINTTAAGGNVDLLSLRE